MKKAFKLAYPLLVILFLFNSCDNGPEPCTPVDLSTCEWDLAKNLPIMAENHVFCSWKINPESEHFDYPIKTARYGHYKVKSYEQFQEIIAHYDTYFAAQGYTTGDPRAPSAMFSSMMDDEEHLNLDEMEAEFDDGMLSSYYQYYLKGGELIALALRYTSYENTVTASLNNAASLDLYPVNMENAVERMTALGPIFDKLAEGVTTGEPTGKELTGTDSADVFYIHSRSKSFSNLVGNLLPNKKFSFQYYNYLSGPEQRYRTEVQLDPSTFSKLDRELVNADVIAVYRRTAMLQPEFSYSGTDPYTNQPMDYYHDGYEKGKLYLLDPVDGSLIRIEDIKTTGVYDFSEGDYQDDYRMKSVTERYLKKTLTGYPGIRFVAFESEYMNLKLY